MWNPLSPLKAVIGRRLVRLVGDVVEDALDRDSHNLERWARRQALGETGAFIRREMAMVRSFVGRQELMEYALSQRTIQGGLLCEFGVAGGNSLRHIAEILRERKIFGFDSFQGLPEDWYDGERKGKYRVETLPSVPPNVVLVQGLFEDTLPSFLEQNPGPAEFIHVDCDLYSSTWTVLGALSGRIQTGTVIVFDEYFNYPGWRDGEFRAFAEFVTASGATFEHLGYCRYYEQVAVRMTSAPRRPAGPTRASV